MAVFRNLFSAVNVIVGIPYYQYLALSPVSCLSNGQALKLKGGFHPCRQLTWENQILPLSYSLLKYISIASGKSIGAEQVDF